MINNIAELIKKMENREIRRLKAGKEPNGAYGVFQNAVREIQTQSSYCYASRIDGEKDFAQGFIYGLLAGYFITPEESELLKNEVFSLYSGFLSRAYSHDTSENIAGIEKGALFYETADSQ